MDRKKSSTLYDIEKIKNKVTVTLITYVYKQGIVGQLTSLLCATIIFWGFYSISRRDLLIEWYGFIWIIVLIRCALIKIYLRQSHPEKNLLLWRRLFIIGAGLGGLSW